MTLVFSKLATKASALLLAAGLVFAGTIATASEDGGTEHFPINKPKEQNWSFAGPFGQYDKGQLQRGLKIYTEVCAACHSLSLMSYRNLEDLGYSKAQIKNYAAEFETKEGKVAGANDRFVGPYANDAEAAESNGGVLPPDLSLIAKARAPERGFPTFIFDIFTMYQENGADYLYSLLTGYKDAPDGHDVGDLNYNPYFISGSELAMAPPLDDESVEYDDGTPNTLDQHAKDIAAFLSWTADPNLDHRKKRGFIVILFLLIFSGLLYFTKKKVWSNLEH